jgi:hypothetical protein
MIVFGPISSVFDYLTFGFLLLSSWARTRRPSRPAGSSNRCSTQVLVVLVIRTRMSPFWRSRPSRTLLGAIVAALATAVLIPLSPLGPRARLRRASGGVLGVAGRPGGRLPGHRGAGQAPVRAAGLTRRRATYPGSGRHPIPVDRSGRSRWIRRCSASNSAMRRVRSRMTAAQSCSASNPLWVRT